MRDVDERGVDALAQLDDLGAHLVAELRVEVRQRLVHEEHLRIAHDGAADGDALALAAGKRLGLAVEIRRDAEDLGSPLHLLLHLVLRDLPQLERELQVLLDRHMRIQRVVLEDHGDVAVLGIDVVHELAVDVELAPGDVLEAGDHAHRGGLAAARRADDDDELAIGDLKVEVVNRDDALFGDLEAIGLLDGLFALFLLLLPLLLVLIPHGIDLLDMP